jgi:hypothetical protein
MKQLLMVFSVLLISKLSYAGLVLEPYLGYQMGTAEATTIGGTTASSKDKGTVVGARVGYSFLVPWVALDYSMYSGKDDTDPAGDLKQTNIGVTVGAQMIPLVRPYAGYIFSAKNEVDDGTGAVTVKGTGMKVGLGFKILPLLNINVEFAKLDYKDVESSAGSSSISDVYSEFKYTTTTIGLSYVF